MHSDSYDMRLRVQAGVCARYTLPMVSMWNQALRARPGWVQRPGVTGRDCAYAQVRNAAGGIVQLVYGEDGLDPVGMEARDGGPVDFPRAVQVVAARERPSDEGALATVICALTQKACVSTRAAGAALQLVAPAYRTLPLHTMHGGFPRGRRAGAGTAAGSDGGAGR